MRVMVIAKGDADSEASAIPSEQLLTAMGAYHDELVKAGIMLVAEGLQPSATGKRVRFAGAQRTVIDRPFTESKELIAGFWLWEVQSMEEAVAWVKRCSTPLGGESEIEIRPVLEADDFGAEYTPELREQAERQRTQIAEQQQP